MRSLSRSRTPGPWSTTRIRTHESSANPSTRIAAPGGEKRDAHLKSADYIDTTKFATLHVKVDNVKKTGDKVFSADATVKLRDIEKKYPVTFTVVDAKDDWIRIEGESKFSRLDFKVGKEKDDGAAPELTAKLHLTLKKS